MTEISETRSKSKKPAHYYFLYLVGILVLVQIIDSYSASYTGAFPSKIIEEFLADYSRNDADATMNLSLGIATLGMYFAFFSQALSDKFGRKPLLVFTTLGMGVSALLLNFSYSIVSYTAILFLSYIFVSSDLWLIYITEESTPEKRGFYTNVVMALGILGPIFIPLFRSIHITEMSPVGSWRGLTYFPIALGIPLSMIIFFTIRETSKYKELGKEVREHARSPRVSLRENLVQLFRADRRGEFIILCIMSLSLGFNYLILQMAESYANKNTGLTEEDISSIITIIALSVIGMYLVLAFLADRIGRKKILYVFSILLPVGTILLYLGGKLGTQEYAFIATGMTFGYVGHNGLQILFRIIIVEILPTGRRGTGSGLRAFLQSLGITGGFFLGSVLTMHLGLGLTFVLFGIPVFANIPLIFRYLKETKGADLSKVE